MSRILAACAVLAMLAAACHQPLTHSDDNGNCEEGNKRLAYAGAEPEPGDPNLEPDHGLALVPALDPLEDYVCDKTFDDPVVIPTADQTEYYVSPDGDDREGVPGTESEPWRTIGHAATEVTAGSTVIVKAGDYYPTEQIVLANSGANGRPDCVPIRGAPRGEDPRPWLPSYWQELRAHRRLLLPGHHLSGHWCPRSCNPVRGPERHHRATRTTHQDYEQPGTETFPPRRSAFGVDPGSAFRRQNAMTS